MGFDPVIANLWYIDSTELNEESIAFIGNVKKMCELFALSSRIPTTVSFSLKQLASHGIHSINGDGWGVAYYQGHDVLLLREPEPASDSALIRYIEKHGPPSQLVISHIRRATQGNRKLQNTQPFQREMGGTVHTFAHNGNLGQIDIHKSSDDGRFSPIGETDSELAFCELLTALSKIWRPNQPPPLADRRKIVSEFAAQWRVLGPANFIYSDGDALFIHAHRRIQENGQIIPPGLHMLHRHCDQDTIISGYGISIAANQKLILVASVPLTDEVWQPLREGEIVVIRHGEVVSINT